MSKKNRLYTKFHVQSLFPNNVRSRRARAARYGIGIKMRSSNQPFFVWMVVDPPYFLTVFLMLLTPKP
jgi:hypothetical protein